MMCAGPQSAYRPPVEQRPVLATTLEVPVVGKQPPEGLMAWLIGPGGRLYAVKPGGDTNIGRAPDNDVVLSDTSVSSRHARIRHGGGNAYYLYDLASTNGTFINGTRMDRLIVYDGDELMFGRVPMTYKQVNLQRNPRT